MCYICTIFHKIIFKMKHYISTFHFPLSTFHLAAHPHFKDKMKYLFSLVSFLLLGLFSNAQCNQWAIEVCESQQTIAPQAEPDLGCSDNCFRVYYRVYLVKAGAQNNQGDQTFSFTNLNMTGSLSVIPATGLSEVNIPQTINCSPNYPGLMETGQGSTPLISYNKANNTIAYQASSSNSQSPVVNWLVQGRTLLFVLAIDIFPGETVTPQFTCGVTLPNTTMECPLTVQHGCSNANFSKTVTQPTISCASSSGIPVLQIGTPQSAPILGYPNRQRAAVWVRSSNTSGNFTFKDLDFLVACTPDIPTYAPTIETGPMNYPVVCNIIPPLPNGTAHQIYVTTPKSTAFTIPQSTGENAQNILFYIVYKGPIYESECATVLARFDTNFGRLDGGDFTCCKPKYGGVKEFLWNNSNNCVSSLCPDINLGIFKPINNSTLGCSSTVGFDIWGYSTTQYSTLTDIKLAFEVKISGNIAYDQTYTYQTNSGATITYTATPTSDPEIIRYDFNYVGGLFGFGPGNSQRLAFVSFIGDNGCLESIKYLDAVVTYLFTKPDGSQIPMRCIPGTSSELTTAATDDICLKLAQVTAENQSGIGIKNWNYYVNYNPSFSNPNCQTQGITANASASFCSCLSPGNTQNIVLKSTIDPLNGVNTFDLISISRHILGLAPLTTFNLIAADANMSNTVTTFDIVELRKLILGSYTSLPNANSWRYFDKKAINIPPLSNPANPFGALVEYPSIPSPNKFMAQEFASFILPSSQIEQRTATFIGVKVGDVDGSATPNIIDSQIEDRNTQEWQLGQVQELGKKGAVLEIPLAAHQSGRIDGLQMDLSYDPSALTIEDLVWETPDPFPFTTENKGWNIVTPGNIRLIWWDAMNSLQAVDGTPICKVKIRLLQDRKDTDAPLFSINRSENGGIPSLLFDHNGTPFQLTLGQTERSALKPGKQQNSLPQTAQLAVYPNPTTGHFRLNIQSDTAQDADLSIFDLSGKTVLNQHITLIQGTNAITSVQLSTVLAPGHYDIQLRTATEVQRIRLVKQ
jgi:Secretion system C-terminal sorting domain